MKKDYEVEDFTRFQGEVMVDMVNGTQHTIDESDFERYLKRNYCLDWVMDSMEGGEHKQTEGTMSLDEYFENHSAIIKIDLEAYLESKKTVSNLFETLGQIFKPFNS